MTENALLLILRPKLMGERLGGLSILERQIWTAHRAGIKRLWVGLPRPEGRLRLPRELEIHWSTLAGGASPCQAPYLLISGDHFIRVETLRYIAQSSYPSAVALEDQAGLPVVQVAPAGDPAGAPRIQPLPPASTVFLESPLDSGPALSWLLSTGAKAQDGFMARHFDRHLSLAISRLLLDAPVSPNMMTILSSALGLYGTTFFLYPGHKSRLAGAWLVWLHSVLDGCDGELARMRFQESRFGGAIDFWGDNFVHLSLFWCLAVGFYKADQSVLPLLLGAAAAVGTLGSAALVYLQRRRGQAAPASTAALRLTRLEDLLAARDFIYLLVLLAYLDRTYEFMWASGVGSLLFLGMMLYLGGRHEQVSQPHSRSEGQAGGPAPGHGGGFQHLHSGG